MSTITERAELSAPPLNGGGASRSCECVVLFPGVNLTCGEPAAGLFRRACVHEHIRDGWMCQGHIDAASCGFCLTCAELDGGLAHECPIALVPVTPDGAA